METQFICKHFDQLSTRELYAILKVRIEVFTLEQACAYQDCDDRDQFSYHLMLLQSDEIIAYSRLIPKGVSYEDYCSIGRVLTTKKVRNLSFGKQLMNESISRCASLFGGSVKIGAQSYLEKFYSDLGFVPTGHTYLEDNIPHMSMILHRS